MKVHKSYVVNLGKIKRIDGNDLHICGAEVPISQSLYESVMKDILKGKMIKR